MRNAIRGFVVLSVLLWLIAPLPGMLVPGAGGGTPALADNSGDDDEGGPPGGLCNQPGDADQVAAVRALAAEQCDCGSASNHGKYVSCVARVVDAAVKDGSLRPECSDAVVHCAAVSTCGRRGFVTCCRADAHGHTSCTVKHGDKACKAPHGGTACVGSVSSCCDACGASGTCPPPGGTTTTTAAPPATTTTSTTAPAGTTTTTAPVATTTTTVPGSPSGAFLDRPEALR